MVLFWWVGNVRLVDLLVGALRIELLGRGWWDASGGTDKWDVD